MQRTSDILDIEWWVILGAAAAVDALQIILEMFFVGLVADSIIDLGFALSLAFYLWILRSYPLELRSFLLIFGTFLVEFIPIVDVAPFWVFDVWTLRKWDMERKSQNKLMAEQARLASEQNEVAV